LGGLGVGVKIVGFEELSHKLKAVAGNSNVKQLGPRKLRSRGCGRVHLFSRLKFHFFYFPTQENAVIMRCRRKYGVSTTKIHWSKGNCRASFINWAHLTSLGGQQFTYTIGPTGARAANKTPATHHKQKGHTRPPCCTP
jgi:hypothetical protein